jgi:3-dehydroquinate synthetase
VGYGLEFAVDLSERLGLATGPSARRMRAAIRAVSRRTPLSVSLAGRARSAALGDKKREGLELKEILLARPGKPLIQRIDARELTGLMGVWILEKAEAHARRGPSRA